MLMTLGAKLTPYMHKQPRFQMFTKLTLFILILFIKNHRILWNHSPQMLNNTQGLPPVAFPFIYVCSSYNCFVTGTWGNNNLMILVTYIFVLLPFYANRVQYFFCTAFYSQMARYLIFSCCWIILFRTVLSTPFMPYRIFFSVRVKMTCEYTVCFFWLLAREWVLPSERLVWVNWLRSFVLRTCCQVFSFFV